MALPSRVIYVCSGCGKESDPVNVDLGVKQLPDLPSEWFFGLPKISAWLLGSSKRVDPPENGSQFVACSLPCFERAVIAEAKIVAEKMAAIMKVK